MHQPPRPRQAPLLDGSVMRRSYLFLGLLEASFSMSAYLLVWHRAGVSIPELQALAPQLETTYLCVVDRHGNAFSSTPSDANFSSHIVPGLGIVCSTWGSRRPSGTRLITPTPNAMARSAGCCRWCM